MDKVNNAWDWQNFRKVMSDNLTSGESECNELLGLIEKCDKIISEILDRPLSYAHSRPQDFVMAILITRSFRLALSSIGVTLSGYPDSAPNLLRTIWEIGIWLLLIENDPVGAPLGFLMSSADSKIKMWEQDLQNERMTKYSSNLEKNLTSWRNHLELLHKVVNNHGLSVEEISSKYKRVNFYEIHKMLDLESKYKTLYRFMSCFVHEQGFAADVYLDESQLNTRGFLLGPTPSGCVEMIYDTLDLLIVNLVEVAAIIGEPKLQKECEKIKEELAYIGSQINIKT